MEMLMEHEHSAKNYVSMPMELEMKQFSCEKCPSDFSNELEYQVEQNYSSLEKLEIRHFYFFLLLNRNTSYRINEWNWNLDVKNVMQISKMNRNIWII